MGHSSSTTKGRYHSLRAATVVLTVPLCLLSTTGLAVTGAAAQSSTATTDVATPETIAPETNMGPGREGTAAPESIALTLASQGAEIRQVLMEGGEMGVDGLNAAIRAREMVAQAIEATGILGNPGDTQVTTTRMNDMDVANTQFTRMAELLDIRIAAIRAGDASAANQARLAVLDAVNDLPNSLRSDGMLAPSDNVTSVPGGAEPILEQ